ncbi:MAG: NUDIX hydrolase, partial [Victivallaceae bacterium]
QMPNGNIIPEYYVLEYPEWVNILAITTDRQVVMIRQYRHALGKCNFELPAGVCDPEDRSILAAAQRELSEETGFGGGEWEEYMVLSANPSTHTNLTHTFIARGVTKLSAQHLEKSEDITVYLLSKDEVFELLRQGEIVQALMAAPLWRWFCEQDN